MTLCKLLEVEPYITVNVGTGDAWSAAQYVEYANGDAPALLWASCEPPMAIRSLIA